MTKVPGLCAVGHKSHNRTIQCGRIISVFFDYYCSLEAKISQNAIETSGNVIHSEPVLFSHMVFKIQIVHI